MKAKDKRIIKSMVKALERFGDCLTQFSDESWDELNNKVDEGEESLPTWNEISSLKKKLKQLLRG